MNACQRLLPSLFYVHCLIDRDCECVDRYGTTRACLQQLLQRTRYANTLPLVPMQSTVLPLLNCCCTLSSPKRWQRMCASCHRRLQPP